MNYSQYIHQKASQQILRNQQQKDKIKQDYENFANKKNNFFGKHKFNIGDQVEIIEGSHKGRFGEVGDINSNYKVIFRNSNNFRWFPEDFLAPDWSEAGQREKARKQKRFERVDGLEKLLQSSPFKIGDSVMIISGQRHGEIGRIIKITNNQRVELLTQEGEKFTVGFDKLREVDVKIPY